VSPPVVTDRTAPSVTVLAVSRSLRNAARRGIRLRLRADEGGALSVRLTVGTATARRLGVAHRSSGRVSLARRQTTLRAGESSVVVEPGKATRRAMKRVRKIRLHVSVAATDAAGNTSRSVRSVTLVR
jgi:hypothetical protein